MPKPSKTRVLHELSLTKIAAVDLPCQEHAQVTIIKNSDSKSAKPGQSGETDEGNHMSVITKMLGLKDDASAAEIDTAFTKYAEDNKTSVDRLSQVEKALAEQSLLAGMSDESRVHYNDLAKSAPADAEAFGKMTEAERKAKLDAAKAGDEVCKMADGTEISKRAVGDASFAIFKKMAEEIKAGAEERAELAKAAADADIEKRIKVDFANIPGDGSDLAKVLRLAKAAPDATKTAFENILKAYNTLLGQAMVRKGHSDPKVDPEDPESQLDVMAKACAKAEKITEDEAFAKVLQTPEGRELYARMDTQ